MKRFSSVLTSIFVTLLIIVLGTLAAILAKIYLINPAQEKQTEIIEKIYHYNVEKPVEITPNAVVIDKKVDTRVNESVCM